jgi:hypothetical protein
MMLMRCEVARIAPSRRHDESLGVTIIPKSLEFSRSRFVFLQDVLITVRRHIPMPRGSPAESG